MTWGMSWYSCIVSTVDRHYSQCHLGACGLVLASRAHLSPVGPGDSFGELELRYGLEHCCAVVTNSTCVFGLLNAEEYARVWALGSSERVAVMEFLVNNHLFASQKLHKTVLVGYGCVPLAIGPRQPLLLQGVPSAGLHILRRGECLVQQDVRLSEATSTQAAAAAGRVKPVVLARYTNSTSSLQLYLNKHE